MTGTARALVAGIRSTRFGGGRLAELVGVPADVSSVASMLRARGFDVLAPTGAAQLTASEVGQALVRCVDQTGPGDLAVIYLTGHGYRYPDRSGDEFDKWDEAFVCSDRPILDDWFREQLWPRSRPGASFVVVVDACHSETMTLGLTRGEPVPVLSTTPGRNSFYRLTLTACRDYETTLDAGGGDGGGGVVTTQMVDLLRSRHSISYRHLWCEVASLVSQRYRGQRIGMPRIDSLGPNDSLLNADGFRWPIIEAS